MPILSPSFCFSKACETEITYAVDKNKQVCWHLVVVYSDCCLQIIPVVCDPGYMEVLNDPEEFTETDEDIELRAPKLVGNLCSVCSSV